MPPLVRQPAQQRQPTGIRLIDDLLGADAEQAPPIERQATSIKPATNYETYVQPAILALRKLVRPVVQSMQEDPLGGYSPAALAGPLATMINLPRGTVLKHGGARAIETVDPSRLRGHGMYGQALYTSEDDFISRHFALKGGELNNTGRGAVTEFNVARDMPIWDAADAIPDDLERFASHLDPDLLKRARRDPKDVVGLTETVQEQIARTPDLLDRAGLSGVRFPYRGSTAVAVTPEAMHRGVVTNPAGERVTEEGRRRYADMMAGLRSASGGR